MQLNQKTTRLALLVAAGAVALSLTGCAATGSASTGSASTGSAPTGSAPTAASTGAPVKAASAGVTPLSYVPLVEPFSAPGDCDEDGSTVQLADCFLTRVTAVDRTVDTLQRKRFQNAAGDTAKGEMLKDDAIWLKSRASRCATETNSGGTIDRINSAGCLLTASQARVRTLQGATG